MFCARAIFYLPMTWPRKKTRRLHEREDEKGFAGVKGRGRGRGEHVIQMGCHSFSLASPDSDSCLPPFPITHVEEATVV